VAAAAARRVKGMVYDSAHQEFNIFRNARDFKHFVKTNHAGYLESNPEIAGKKGTEDLEMIRGFIGEVH